jgi:hypothetical protein
MLSQWREKLLGISSVSTKEIDSNKEEKEEKSK